MSLSGRARLYTATACSWIVVIGTQVHADGSGPAANSVFDGVFTAEQSARGKLKYSETCERCHKEDLSGDLSEEIPALVGDKFLSEWIQWTVGDLFELATTKMPPKRVDRRDLSHQNYVDMLAYILERNGFPAGDTELAPTIEPLLEIEMSAGE